MRPTTNSLVYDPSIVGYDTTIFKALSGAPAMSGSLLRLNAAEICTYGFWRRLIAEFTLTIPAAPTAGDVRAFGLKAPALGNRGRAEFTITGAVIAAVAYNDAGTLVCNQTITWDVAWNNTPVRFKIDTKVGPAKFYINDTLVATATGKSSIPTPLHINNANADALDMTAVMAKDGESYN